LTISFGGHECAHILHFRGSEAYCLPAKTAKKG